jgi:hypothetical protein
MIGGTNLSVMEMLDDGTNSGDFDAWLQQVQTSRVAAPMLGGLGSTISSVLFGQEAAVDESAGAAAEPPSYDTPAVGMQIQEQVQAQLAPLQAQLAAMTPVPVGAASRPAASNPALNPPSRASQYTPVPSTPLERMRAGGALNTNSGGVSQSASVSAAAAKKDDRTIPEQLMTAGAATFTAGEGAGGGHLYEHVAAEVDVAQLQVDQLGRGEELGKVHLCR